MSAGTKESLALSGHRINVLEERKPAKLCSLDVKNNKVVHWVIKPFSIEHDAKEPFGYLMSSSRGGKLAYITDSFYSRYNFQELTHLMIECNYAKDILDENVRSGRVPASRKKRVIQSHFSLENVKEFLRANDLSQLQEIWLLHLSSDNSDAERFKREIQQLAGIPVYIAE